MRIGFLTHAGASIYHFRMPIIKALIERGDEVFIITPKDEYASKLEKLNLNLVYYELKRASLNPITNFKNFLYLKNILKNLNLDLIQAAAHKSNTFGLIAAKFAKTKHKIALVEGLGSFYIDESFKSKIIKNVINNLYKISFKIADKFIFVNEANAKFMRDLGLSESKICVIKSVGIDLSKFFPLMIDEKQKEAFLSEYKMPKKPIVLMVSRALWHKGIKEFYEAARILKNEANFILVGGLDDNKSCASLEFLQNKEVFYLGQRDDIFTLLNLCDIFVLPSYKEGFPVSVLEAKACAKPCVVSDCEGCVEAINNGFDGLLAKTADALDLSEKIKLLIDDEKLRLNLGQNAFKDALKYDSKVIAEKYLQIYNEVLNV